MAVRTTFVQDGAYNSPDLRYAQGMLAPRNIYGFVMSGLIDIGQPAALVTAGGGLNVRVGIFMAVAPDSGSGVYVGGNDAQVTIPVRTPETANNRVDLLCWRPLEGLATTSTGASTMGSVTLAGAATAASKQIVHGEIYFVKGAPSAGGSPTIPATPSGAVPLARVYVAGGATTISTANITQAYTYLASAQPNVAADVPSLRGVGTGAWQAAAGNHSHTPLVSRLTEFSSTPNVNWPVGSWGTMFGGPNVLAGTAPGDGIVVTEASVVAYAAGNAAGPLALDVDSNKAGTQRVTHQVEVHTNGVAMGFTRNLRVYRTVTAGEVLSWKVSGYSQPAGLAINTKMFDLQMHWTRY